MANKLIWLNDNFIKGWNKEKSSFCIQDPKNEEAVIWFNKIFYKNSKYENYFGLEIPEKHYLTGEELVYTSFKYEKNKDVVRICEYSGAELLELLEIKKEKEKVKYKKEKESTQEESEPQNIEEAKINNEEEDDGILWDY